MLRVWDPSPRRHDPAPVCGRLRQCVPQAAALQWSQQGGVCAWRLEVSKLWTWRSCGGIGGGSWGGRWGGPGR